MKTFCLHFDKRYVHILHKTFWRQPRLKCKVYIKFFTQTYILTGFETYRSSRRTVDSSAIKVRIHCSALRFREPIPVVTDETRGVTRFVSLLKRK